MVPDHPPEVTHSVRQWTLASYVLVLSIVALQAIKDDGDGNSVRVVRVIVVMVIVVVEEN